ncbi:MAG: hypothetical protein O7I42_18670 [Alphaproteobacteria bacterium]|nr:hypothetical protein [Alphaproteobacteria bacterium]
MGQLAGDQQIDYRANARRGGDLDSAPFAAVEFGIIEFPGIGLLPQLFFVLAGDGDEYQHDILLGHRGGPCQ